MVRGHECDEIDARFPIAALSFAAGVVTLSALDYPSGGGEPLRVDLLVDLVAPTVLLTPCGAQRCDPSDVRDAFSRAEADERVAA